MKPEADVKKQIKEVLERYTTLQFMHVPTGYGVKGIHDHIACVPLEIKPEHVGKKLGVFVSIEAKREGKTMSTLQEDFFTDVKDMCGFVMCVDGTREEDGNFEEFELRMQNVFGGTTSK